MKLLLMGDIRVDNEDPDSTFRSMQDYFDGVDFIFGNLEAAYSDLPGAKWHKGGEYGRRSGKIDGAAGVVVVEPINQKVTAGPLSALKTAPFDAVSLANNRIMDFGVDPALDTVANLDALGIAHSGFGKDLEAAHAPAIVEKNGLRIGLLSYTSVFMRGWEADVGRPGVAAMRAVTSYEPLARAAEVPGMPSRVRTQVMEEDVERLRSDIKRCCELCDLVICSFHWGISGGNTHVIEYQKALGRHAIDFGAELVFGHHPHVFHGAEVYKGRALLYSLGNFSYDSPLNKSWMELETIIASCEIKNSRVVDVEIVPVVCNERAWPGLADKEAGERIRKRFEARSADFKLRAHVTGESLKIVDIG